MNRTVGIGLVVGLLVLAAVPGIAAAQSQVGSTVGVPIGETVEQDVQAVGGTVVVRGSVYGNVTAVGADVLVTGVVSGDVTAVGGTVTVEGAVGDDVRAAGGAVRFMEDSQVGGNASATAMDVSMAGTVDGDATVSARHAELIRGGSIGGDLRYADAVSSSGNPQVGGETSRIGGLAAHPLAVFAGVPGFVVPVYGMVSTFLVGAILLVALPKFSMRVLANVARDPLETTLTGILAAVAIPVALAVAAITVVGLPLAVVGVVLLAVLVWLGSIYGRFALGAWLLSRIDAEQRWLSLVVGVLVVGLATLVPILGRAVEIGVLLLGFGALSLAVADRFEFRQ